MKQFDLVDGPLQGRHLIEASAGTGKTFTLAHLFLRLVLERDMPVEQILVVTFTEAATAELRDRVHALLTDALHRSREQISPADEIIDRILAKAPPGAAGRLERALHAFDDAAIFTIHGFCHRILLENAFETGALFNTELIADQQELITEAAEDFWRIHCLDHGRLFTGYLLDSGWALRTLVTGLGRRALQPALHIVPHEERWPEALDLEEAFVEQYAQAQAAWEACREQVTDYLLNSGALNGTVYRRAAVPKILGDMARFMTNPPDSPSITERFAKFELFTTDKLMANVKKQASPPSSTDFFDACQTLLETSQELCACYATRVNKLKCDFIASLRNSVATAKEARHVQSFDDLLTGFEAALRRARGSRLADAVRRRFSAALIDEFQDTDQVQYAIFSRIFDNPDSTIFLIGDPKQAIYGFRGADVFTYMRAKDNIDASSRFTLLVNHRSSPGLVRAVNAIFAGKHLPFLFDGIPFHEGSAATKDSSDRLLIDGREPAPLHLWFLPGTTDDKGKLQPLLVGAAEQRLAEATAAEIVDLLTRAAQGRAHIGTRPLRPADIAVLVRKNEQALRVRGALAAAGVPAVMHGMGSVYESEQALHLQRILAAVLEPNNAAYIRAALATDALGMTAVDIATLREDETAMSAVIERFAGYNQFWRRAGFAAMIRRLGADNGVALNLLRFEDGERRLTDFNHLCELLQSHASASGMGMQELLAWLTRRRADSTTREEEHELRLDSDDNAVTVVTIHRSKGLQYPVVFCPFVTGGSHQASGDALYHDGPNGERLTYDFGSEHIDRARRLCSYESLAESIRLFYVALTRAKYRCYTAWGKINGSWTSAPAYLFHGGSGPALPDQDIGGRLRTRIKDLDNAALREPLATLSRASDGAIVVSDLHAVAPAVYRPAPARTPSLSARQVTRTHADAWRISSFTSLVHDRHDETQPDVDMLSLRTVPPPPPADETAETLFTFPRGAQAGTVLHRVLELIDFVKGCAPENEVIVQRTLEQSRFEGRWTPVVCELLEQLRTSRLHDGLVLGDIDRRRRLDELEFYFPLQAVDPRTLGGIFANHGQASIAGTIPSRIEELELNTAGGYMHGFIDCVCTHRQRYYLIDWKSNYLGATLDDYARTHVDRAMLEECYFLQYHIYAVALDRYLATRLPDYDYERHFGGVYYVFLRGMQHGAPSGTGVYFDRPSRALIDALGTALIPKVTNGGRAS
ncbi:MAG: exodeoxyribonuclease V subunit beta [Chitinivibrionales bacterium]|nr:exodeoxyribonuclease V subunit beta [Chitinivibrionales bacterium]